MPPQQGRGVGAAPAYVVVSGPPGSGKTTLARRLCAELGLPLIAKDTIKEALMTSLPVPDVATSQLVGRASVSVLLAMATDNGRGVLDSVWHRSKAGPDLARLPGDIVEVCCRCPRELAEQRYRARAVTRAAGHFDGDRHDDELWNPEVTEPVAAGWPVIEVDTSQPVDVAAVAEAVRAAHRQR